MCQNGTCSSLKPFTPLVSTPSATSLGKERLPISPALSYIYERFLDKTDKKVICKRARVEEA